VEDGDENLRRRVNLAEGGENKLKDGGKEERNPEWRRGREN
jgi:hypothetical protein